MCRSDTGRARSSANVSRERSRSTSQVTHVITNDSATGTVTAGGSGRAGCGSGGSSHVNACARAMNPTQNRATLRQCSSQSFLTSAISWRMSLASVGEVQSRNDAARESSSGPRNTGSPERRISTSSQVCSMSSKMCDERMAATPRSCLNVRTSRWISARVSASTPAVTSSRSSSSTSCETASRRPSLAFIPRDSVLTRCFASRRSSSNIAAARAGCQVR